MGEAFLLTIGLFCPDFTMVEKAVTLEPVSSRECVNRAKLEIAHKASFGGIRRAPIGCHHEMLCINVRWEEHRKLSRRLKSGGKIKCN